MDLLERIILFIEKLFSTPNSATTQSRWSITYIPQLGDKSDNTKMLQMALNGHNFGMLKVDGDFGPATLRVVKAFQRYKGLKGSGILGVKTINYLGLNLSEDRKPSKIKAPWLAYLKKHEGKKETDEQFQTYMNKYWVRTGLPNFKGLVGSARAWCGIFAVAGLIYAGYAFPVNSFRAKSWDGFGHAIAWKQDGIPMGAYVRLNGKGDCNSASNNHITIANGSCTAKTLAKPNATYAAFGGNQGNQAKVSVYKVSTICYVGWPKEEAKPSKVLKDNNCTGLGATNESTR